MKKIGIILSLLTLFLTCLAVSVDAAEAEGRGAPEAETSGAFETSSSQSTESNTEEPAVLSATAETYELRSEGGEFRLLDGDGNETARGSLTETIAMLPSTGARVTFSSVTLTETLTLSAKRLSILGTLTFTDGAGLILSDGTSAEIAGATLRFSDGGIRVKEGTLTLSAGHIESTGCAVTLDYASDALFRMTGGEILTAGENAAVKNLLGTVTLTGGAVRNTEGVAVYSEGTLRLGGSALLSGQEVDAAATLPITLTAENVPFSGTMRVRLLTSFQKGTETLAFYGAVAGMETKITLYDEKGNSCPLVYRELGETIDERNYLAVSLPYRYPCYVDGTESGVLSGFSGKTLTPPEPPTKRGYTFDGWYVDTALTERMDFSAPPAEDTALYAKFSLLPPTFSLSALTFTYDGELHDLTFSSLSHELASEGLFSFEWYRNDVLCKSSAKTLKLRNVSEYGSYYCKITFTKGRDSVTVITPSVEVKIGKKLVEIPTADSKFYNGARQTSSLFDTADYTVTENEGGVHAGEYPLVLTLTDAENRAFVGTEDASVTLLFHILQAENSFLGEVTISDYFESGSASPFARARFGTSKFFYASAPDGDYRETPPQTAGRYYLRVEVEETADYAALRSLPVPFSVKEVTVLSIRVGALPEKCEYRAFEHFLPAGLSVYATYSDGREEEVALSALTFAYPDGATSFHVRSPYLLISYCGADVTLPLTVRAADYPMSGISFPDRTFVYDGVFHTIDPVGTLPTGEDGSRLSASVTGGGTDAGNYTLTLTFRSGSEDYLTPPPMTASLTLLPKETEILFGNTSFVYNGETRCPDAWYIDVFGKKIKLPVLGGKSEAGEGYTATACPSDGNYSFLGLTTLFSVAKAAYDLSSVSWSDVGFVYDGSIKRVTLTGLPAGVGVIGYADAEGKNAGTYTARVTLSYDTRNYEEPVIPPYVWVIERAKYPLTYAFPESVFVYDGTARVPRMTGTLPVGADGSVPIPVFDRTVTHVSEGKCIVRITFTTTSENYKAPDEIVSAVSITPAPARVVWDSLTFTYTGGECLPTARAEAFDVSVSGAMVDAGEYTAFASSLCEDYMIENDTATFCILPAENHWITTLLPTKIYESAIFDGSAVPFYGNATLRFFSDSTLEHEIDLPRSHGTYYMRAEVAASRNYRALIGESVILTLLEVLPVSLRITLCKNELVAFDTLSPSDFTAQIFYNDGSVTEADTREILISYRNGDSLRTSDDTVGFSRGTLTERVPVKVKKRSVDLSAVRVSEEEFVYDGTTHTIFFTDLPSVFSVSSYDGAELLSAGEYTVTATLSFDFENYDAPRTLSRTVRVLRAGVLPPALSAWEYDGTEKVPTVPDSPLYTVVFTESGTHAGTYTVTLRLTDPANYTFEGNASEDGAVCNTTFVVLPRRLVYELSDVTLYRGEAPALPFVTLVSGEILAGEDPLLRLHAQDDVFVLTVDNPDYTVEFSGGNILRTAKLSPAKIRTVFFFVLLGLLILLLLLFLYAKREQIRCRILLSREERRARRAREAERLAVLASEHISAAPPKTETSPKTETTNENAGEATALSEEPIEEAPDGEEDPTPSVEEDLPSPPSASTEESEEDLSNQEPEEELENRDAGEDPAKQEPVGEAVCAETADALITDALARELLTSEEVTIPTLGNRRGVVNVDTLSRNFGGGERVDINLLKEKTLIPYDTGYLKILARGVIDKPLTVYADDFSLQAVKMIALTGGEAVRARTVPKKERK